MWVRVCVSACVCWQMAAVWTPVQVWRLQTSNGLHLNDREHPPPHSLFICSLSRGLWWEGLGGWWGCQEVLGITLLGRNKGSLPLAAGPEEGWIVLCIVPVRGEEKRWVLSTSSASPHTHTHIHPALCVLSRSSTGSSCKTGSRPLTTRSQLLLFVWKISGLNGSISTVTLVSFPLFTSTFFGGPFCCCFTCVPISPAAWMRNKAFSKVKEGRVFLSSWSAVEWKVWPRLQINRRQEPSGAAWPDWWQIVVWRWD